MRDRARRFAALCAGALATATAPTLAPAQARQAPAPSAFEREITQSRVMVRSIVLQGARSLSAADVREVAVRYEGRALDDGDLREIERRFTQLYIDRGYVTSGVVLKARPQGEEAVFVAVEGTIDQVRFVEPPRHASARWLASRLVPDPRAPARLADLQERMTAMRESGIVERINAELVPLPEVGLSELRVTVEESRPWDIELRYDNYHSPAVGARRPSAIFSHRNLSGWGDGLTVRLGRTQGLHDARVDYAIPVPRTPWRLGVRYERSDSLAIDPPAFRELDIASYARTAGAEVGYSWLNRPALSFATSVAFEKRESESMLLGMPFSFVAGIPDGISKVDVVRAIGELNASRTDQVTFARAQVSVGRTNVSGEAADAAARRFRSIALQAQYARRLSEWGLQGLARIDAQFTNDSLLPLEKKPLGGIETVRGCRENVLLRDRAVAATLELRAPVWRWEERVRLIVSVFADAGWGRDAVARDDGLPRRISSVGIGLALVLPAGLSLRIDHARPNVRWLTERRDWQDRGLHFQLSWRPAALLP